MPAEVGYNIYANTFQTGLNDASPEGFDDEFFDYVGKFAVAAAKVDLPNQLIQVSTDSDFALWGLTITGITAIRFATSQGFYLSDSPILVANLGGGGFYPVFPEIVFPAGGAIRVDLQDPTGAGAPNVVVICHGVKRYAKL